MTAQRSHPSPAVPLLSPDIIAELERFNAPAWMIERARRILAEQEDRHDR